MGIIDQDLLIESLSPRKGDTKIPGGTEEFKEQEAAAPDFSETVKAQFFTRNWIGSFIMNGLPNKTVSSPDFDPFQNVVGTKYEKNINDFIFADDDNEVSEIMTNLDTQEQYNEIIENSHGVSAFAAALTAQILDPTMLLPATAGMKAIMGGARVVEGLRSGAALGVATIGLQDAALAATSKADIGEDFLTDIVVGGIAGGMLGAGIGLLSKPSRVIFNAAIKDIFNGTEKLGIKLNAGGKPEFVGDSVGAAKASGKLDDEGLARLNSALARQLSSPIAALRSPVIEGLTNKRFKNIQAFANNMFDHNFILDKNLKGEASVVPFEAFLQDDVRTIAKDQDVVKDLFFKSRGLERGGPFREFVQESNIKLKKESKGTWEKFNSEVSMVIRTGTKSAIPEANEAAEHLIKRTESITKDLKAAGILAEDQEVSLAANYLSRVYNTRKLRTFEGRSGFLKDVTDHFEEKGLDPIDALEEAGKVSDNIIGEGDKALGLSEMVSRLGTKSGKFTKQRVLDMTDEKLLPYLIQNASEVYSSFAHKASKLIHFNKMLERNGFKSLEEWKGALRDEMVDQRAGIIRGVSKKKGDTLAALGKKLENKELTDAERAAIEAEQGEVIKSVTGKLDEPSLKKVDKELAALAKDFSNGIKYMDNVTDLFLGTKNRGGLDRGLAVLRKYQTMTSLGGVVISSFTDPTMNVFKHGVGATLVDGYYPLARRIMDTELNDLVKNDLRDLGVGFEIQGNNILKTLTDPDFKLHTDSSFIEDATDTAMNAFSKVSLMEWWNNTQKQLAGHISAARIVRGAEKVSKTGFKSLDRKTQERFLQLGLDENKMKGIWEQFDRFGTKKDGSFITHVKDWEGEEIKQAMRIAVQRETDTTILTPRRGDIPFAVQKNSVAQTLFQFSSFSAKASNAILLSGLQRRDSEAITGLVGLIGTGMMIYVIKEKIAGRDVDLSPDNLLVEGFSRGGVGGLMADKAMAFNPWHRSSRYRNYSIQSAVLGPTVGNTIQLAQDMSDTIGKATTPGESVDWSKIRRYIYGQNLFYLQAGMTAMEKKK